MTVSRGAKAASVRHLVAEQGRAVPRDELAEALWGERPPATWDKALTVLVSKLRSLLGEDGPSGGVLTGAFGCYRLDLPRGNVGRPVRSLRAAHRKRKKRSPQARLDQASGGGRVASHWRAGRSCPVTAEGACQHAAAGAILAEQAAQLADENGQRLVPRCGRSARPTNASASSSRGPLCLARRRGRRTEAGLWPPPGNGHSATRSLVALEGDPAGEEHLQLRRASHFLMRILP